MQPYRGPDGSITDPQQLDLLDGAGLAGVRGEGRPPEGRHARDRPVGVGGQERDPVRLEDRLPGRMSAGVLLTGRIPGRDRRRLGRCGRGPARGRCRLLHHDSLLADGGPPLAVAALLSLFAWQVMIGGDDAAVEPAAREAVRARIGAGAAAAARRWRRSSAATRSCGAGSGWPRSARTPALHAGINSSSWLAQHDWSIGGLGSGPGGRVPVHIAQGRLPRQVPPPRPVPDAPLRPRRGRAACAWACATACSASAAAGP